jgi:hypothetical protein
VPFVVRVLDWKKLVRFKDGSEVMGRILIPVGGEAVSDVPVVEFHP